VLQEYEVMMKLGCQVAGAALLAVASSALSPAAMAQMPFPMGPGGGGQMPAFPFPMGPPGQMPGGSMGMGYGGQCPAEFVKSMLGITDAQKGVWESYASALKANAPASQRAYDKSAVEQLDAQLTETETRLKSLRELKPRLVALYAALNADQKKKADQLVGMGCML
jgi:hypothetical protein